MSLTDSLRLTWFRGLTQAVQRNGFTTEVFLASRMNTVISAESGEFNLFCDPREAASYFACEADRFAAAAFESLLTGCRSDVYPRSTGWLLIRCYYAAFFALHSLLRIKGVACTRVIPASLANVNRDAASLFGQTAAYGAGLYILSLEDDARTIVCRKIDSNFGGTHEMLWSQLQPYLAGLVETVLSDGNEVHQELVVLIDSFQRVLNSRGGERWFTKLRNEINYSHSKGAWFPYRGTTSDYDRVSQAIDGWMQVPSPVMMQSDELIQFVVACKFLISTCAATVRDIDYRCVPRSPFRVSSGLLIRPRP